jgi:hypothetical protein
MAKDRTKDRDHPASVRGPGERGTAGGETAAGGAHGGGGGEEHRSAKAHGKAAQVDTRLPGSRPELMALHAEARKRRAAAPLGSEAFRAAVDEIGRIEIRIAAVDRGQDPPLG